MKLDAGTITINKPLEQVFAFLSKLENLEKQLPSTTIDDYEIGFDDNISGEIRVGTIIAIYLFPIYEGDEDLCLELEVVEIEEYATIKLKLAYVGKYDEERDDWSDSMPIESFFGVMGYEMDFSQKNHMTTISIPNSYSPKSKLAGIAIKIFNFIGKVSYKKHLKEWAKLVEQHA
jgi:hypothetical protein